MICKFHVLYSITNCFNMFCLLQTFCFLRRLYLDSVCLLQIFSRGGISIQNHKFSCIGQKCLSSNFQVKPQFFPRSSIAVYYVTDESEILSDEIIIDVTHFHLGMVSQSPILNIANTSFNTGFPTFLAR